MTHSDDALRRAIEVALNEAARVVGEYHWNRYAKPDEGGELWMPAVFTSHTHQDAVACIRALSPTTF